MKIRVDYFIFLGNMKDFLELFCKIYFFIKYVYMREIIICLCEDEYWGEGRENGGGERNYFKDFKYCEVYDVKFCWF